MTASTVSIIIPTYNRASLVAETVRSALDQTYQHREIIVVDDGSIDATRTALAPFRDDIVYIHQPHRGQSAARNAGIRHACGRYLAFLDSDDLILPTKLETQVRFLDRHPEVGIVYGNGYTMNDCRALKPLEPYVVPLKDSDCEMAVSHLLWRNLFALHTALVRREALPSLSPFDQSLGAFEDWDLWLRMALSGCKISYQDEKVAIYRRYPGNMDGGGGDVFTDPLRAIVLKVVARDLDTGMPTALRRRYRLGYLDIILAFGSLRVVLGVLHVILFSAKRPSIDGLASLALAFCHRQTGDRVWELPVSCIVKLRVPSHWRRRARRMIRAGASAISVFQSKFMQTRKHWPRRPAIDP